jgi:hypothetical protein
VLDIPPGKMVENRSQIRELYVELNKGGDVGLFVSPEDATAVACEVEKDRKTQGTFVA